MEQQWLAETVAANIGQQLARIKSDLRDLGLSNRFSATEGQVKDAWDSCEEGMMQLEAALYDLAEDLAG